MKAFYFVMALLVCGSVGWAKNVSEGDSVSDAFAKCWLDETKTEAECNALNGTSASAPTTEKVASKVSTKFLGVSGLQCISKAIQDATGTAPAERWLAFVAGGVASVPHQGKYLGESTVDQEKIRRNTIILLQAWGFCSSDKMNPIAYTNVVTDDAETVNHKTQHTSLTMLINGQTAEKEVIEIIERSPVVVKLKREDTIKSYLEISSIKTSWFESWFSDPSDNKLFGDLFTRKDPFSEIYTEELFQKLAGKDINRFLNSEGNNYNSMKSCLAEIIKKNGSDSYATPYTQKNKDLCLNMMTECELTSQYDKNLCNRVPSSTSKSHGSGSGNRH